MKKKIAILGSTGSIGKTLINIIKKDKKNFEIFLLSADENYKELMKQAKLFKVNNLIITNKDSYKKIKAKKISNKTKIFNNFESFKKIFKRKIDYTMSSISGIEGLKPTIEIIKYTKNIAIANKEAIICGWSLISKELKNKTNFIPVDSEHFSIWYALKGIDKKIIEKIYLTASGGPFLNYPMKKFYKIKMSQAVNHPNWKMGKKISIDSSTLMNKMLEVIEAQRLFSIPENKIDILIHPDSLVHAIIQFKNGLTKFLYHETSMKIPISNAIFNGKLNIEDFYKFKINENKIINDLKFMKVDKNTFPIIKIKHRINEFPSTPIIINACNEILVDQFLQKKIKFSSISKIIMGILNDKNYTKYAIRNPKNINQIIKIDNWARMVTLNKIK